jgi:hypothetical protein
MTTPTNPIELFTPFLPSTYDVPNEKDRLDAFLVEKFCNFADVINDKKIGAYTQEAENLNGEKWIYKVVSKVRSGYQAIAYIASYPNSGVLTLTLTSTPAFPISNINSQFVITNLWGSASKPCTDPDNTTNGNGDYFSFYSQGDTRVSFTMSNKQIIITTTTNLSAYSGFIVIEYVRDGF